MTGVGDLTPNMGVSTNNKSVQIRGDFNKAKKSLRFIFDKTQIQGNKGVSLIAWRLIP